jgi:hypothetical protein
VNEDRITPGYRGEPVLRVSVAKAYEDAPPRPGWVPFFVAVDLKGWPDGAEKVVSYRREEA